MQQEITNAHAYCTILEWLRAAIKTKCTVSYKRCFTSAWHCSATQCQYNSVTPAVLPVGNIGISGIQPRYGSMRLPSLSCSKGSPSHSHISKWRQLWCGGSNCRTHTLLVTGSCKATFCKMTNSSIVVETMLKSKAAINILQVYNFCYNY
jgi:hypothetical protein